MKGGAEGEIDRRLCALGERFAVPTAGARSLRVLLALLAEDPTAPTTVTDPCEGIDAHLADALVALELPAFRAARTLVDLGAGPGVPGLPLAAALPGARVYLVESVGRKASFLAGAVDAMGLGNVEVVWGRVETWAAGRGVCDVVCARALARLDVVVEYAAPLLRDGGQLVAWKGRRDAEE
nr:16S rRNA (guanine(527)-N(7))-methyltransferase RsmG [Solirubrobacterales bacterium]